MEFYFKEHADAPLVTKTLGYRTFTIRHGVAEVPDVPDIDPKLTGPAKNRATRQRQAEVEGWQQAARELGGAPLAEAEIAKASATKKTDKGGKD